MEDQTFANKKYLILRFLNQQNEYIKYEDFPNYITDLFEDSLGPESLMYMLTQMDNKLIEGDNINCYKIRHTGIIELQKWELKNNERAYYDELSQTLLRNKAGDIQKTKWYRKWGFIVALVGVLLLLLLWLIDKYSKTKP